jgi:hypothetical protein
VTKGQTIVNLALCKDEFTEQPEEELEKELDGEPEEELEGEDRKRFWYVLDDDDLENNLPGRRTTTPKAQKRLYTSSRPNPFTASPPTRHRTKRQAQPSDTK